MPETTLSIVIPVYNEVGSLSLLYGQLSEVLVRLEIVYERLNQSNNNAEAEGESHEG